MKNLMRQSGWNLICEDDHANYSQRMDRLQRDEINFAVVTVDSYILNGSSRNFPGVIIMVIDESSGGDAILSRQEKIDHLDAIKGRKDIRVAFTPDSPSHHLAKAAADHFNIPELMAKGKFIQTNGSAQACQKLIKGDADIAICWEPDVSRALEQQGIIKLIGTEDTRRLIVDILVVNRNFAHKNADVVKLLLKNYFKALKKYRDDPDLLIDLVQKESDLDKKAVQSMLKGVKWTTFSDNCENWFGISTSGRFINEALIATIESTTEILINSGDFTQSPIPDGDPYRLTNRSFLESLFKEGVDGYFQPKSNQIASDLDASVEAPFSPLTDAEWRDLKEVGTLKVEPIIFQQGRSELDLLSKKVVDAAVERLKHYPYFRLLIKGHTDNRGDPKANRILSQERAEAVARYLQVVYSIDPNRLKAIGFGGEKPLVREPDESLRSWKYRLPRVELVLVKEDY